MKIYFTFLEAKEAIIARAPWPDEQKKEIQELVDKYPQKASKIDWNKIKELKADDVIKALQETSKKDIKKGNITGITAGKDYIDISTDEYEAYIPLTYAASRILANEKVGGCEGKWCTAYQKNQRYWTGKVFQEEKVLVYLIARERKFAIVYPPKPPNTNVQIWTAENNHVAERFLKEQTGVTIYQIEQKFDFYQVRKKIEDHPNNKWYYGKTEFGQWLYEQIKMWKEDDDEGQDINGGYLSFIDMLQEFYIFDSMSLTELAIDYDELVDWISYLEPHFDEFEALHDAIKKKTMASLSTVEKKKKDIVFDVFIEYSHEIFVKMISLDKLAKIDMFLSRELDFDGHIFVTGIWSVVYKDNKRLKRFCEIIANKKYNHTIIREYFNQGGD